MSDHETPVSIWKRLFVGAGVFVLLLILLAAGHYWLQRSRDAEALRQALADLDDTDPGWRLAEIEAARPSVADENNSALSVQAAHRLLPPGSFGSSFMKQVNRRPVEPEPLDAEQMAILEAELQSVSAGLTEARKLADMPAGRYPPSDYGSPFVNPVVDQHNSYRVLALLKYDARHQAHKGDMKAALRSCRAMFHLARSLDDEPTDRGQRTRFTCADHAAMSVEGVLSLGEPSVEDLTSMQRLVEEEGSHDGLLVARRGSRAWVHYFLEGLANGTISARNVINSNTPELPWRLKYASWTASGLARREHVQILNLLSWAVENARLPLHEQAAAEKDLLDRFSELAKGSILTRLAHPGADYLGRDFRHHIAEMRCLTVLLALERWRRDKGTWPATLEALTPNLVKTIPLDPFDGKPLRYRRLVDGVVVYSVDADLIDDGGFIHGMKRSSRSSTRDVGLRLWDVECRRRPPKPAATK